MVDSIGILSMWGGTMPCKALQSILSGFLCGVVYLPSDLVYSVIQFSYSLIIHCFKGKHRVYTAKKLEYTEKRVKSVWIYCIVWICYGIVNIDRKVSIKRYWYDCIDIEGMNGIDIVVSIWLYR